MRLDLTFQDGLLRGGGDDDVGTFFLKGRYDADSLEVYWTKTYPGRHDVFYRGFGEKGWIWGTWMLSNGMTGGFKIWPRRAGAEEASTAEAAAEIPDAVPVHPAPSLE